MNTRCAPPDSARPHRSQSSLERIAGLRQQLQHRHQEMATTSHQLHLAIRGELSHPLILCSAAGLGFVLGHRRPPRHEAQPPPRHNAQHEAQKSSLLATGLELLLLVEYLLKRPEQPTTPAIPRP